MTDTLTTMQVLRMLVAAYPRAELGDKTIPLYDELLADIPPDILKAAALDHVSESVFFPAIAELRKRAFALMGESDSTPSAYEAWELAMRYVRQGRGHPIAIARSEWEDIHPLVEQSVRQVGGWAHLGQAENVTADRARFIEAYDRGLEKQEYKTRQLPQIADLAQRLSLPVSQPREALEVKALEVE